MVRNSSSRRRRGGEGARHSHYHSEDFGEGHSSHGVSGRHAAERFEHADLPDEHRGRISYSAAARSPRSSRSRRRSTVPIASDASAEATRRERHDSRHVASAEMEAAAALAQKHVEQAEAAAAKKRAQGDVQRQAAVPDAPDIPVLPDAAGSHSAQAFASAQESHDESSAYSRAVADSRYTARKQGMSLAKKVLVAVAAVLVVALGVGGFAFASWLNGIESTLEGDKLISNTTEAAEGPYYVLLLGGDSRADSKKDNRTDSIMVARIDEQNKAVSLLSVPRDLRVSIPGHGYQKINSAIESGGYDAVVSKVNDVLGVQINYYAFIYFSGFKGLVDKLGGVKVDVPHGTYYEGVWVPEGENVKITGEEALVLARCRHGNPPDQGAYAMGDYQRTLNQRNLIKAIGKRVLEQDATQLPGLIDELVSCVETNMSVSRILTLAQNMRGMDMDDLEAAQMPIAGATIGGEWFAIMYKDVFDVMLKNFVGGKAIMDNLAKFDKEMNDSDIGGDYTDADPYSYTSYERHWGQFKGKKK